MKDWLLREIQVSFSTYFDQSVLNLQATNLLFVQIMVWYELATYPPFTPNFKKYTTRHEVNLVSCKGGPTKDTGYLN